MKKVNAFELDMKKTAWDSLFDSEQELVDAMMSCVIERGKLVPKGYEYIRSFQRYYAKNGALTDRQMTQLKRLAKPIYVAVNGLNVGGYVVRMY